MIQASLREDLSKKIKLALDKAVEKVVADTKAKNSYMVIADEKGNIQKIAAKDL